MTAPKTHARNADEEITPNQAMAGDLGAPVLLLGEDPAAYERLLAQVGAAVAPRDIIEEIWVRDIVDLSWEVIRLRRLKASLLSQNAWRGVASLLLPITDYGLSQFLAEQWRFGNEEVVTQVNRLLGTAGLTMDSVMAETLSLNLKPIERFDQLVANAEVRRMSVLREVDRHRTAFAALLRQSVQEIEDAEFSDVSDAGGKAG